MTVWITFEAEKKKKKNISYFKDKWLVVLNFLMMKLREIKNILRYHNDPKFSDRQVYANSADPGQTARTWSSLIRVYTVCHSVCIFGTHYTKVKPLCSTFRVITANFSGVQIFRNFLYVGFDKRENTSGPTYPVGQLTPVSPTHLKERSRSHLPDNTFINDNTKVRKMILILTLYRKEMRHY